MADINQVIIDGIGPSADGAHFILFGLSPGGPGGGQSFPECINASTAQSLVPLESVSDLMVTQTASSLVIAQTVEHC